MLSCAQRKWACLFCAPAHVSFCYLGLTLPHTKALVCQTVDAEDRVYCSQCNKKEGADFLLCDACDGGMHRQCAKLDQVPEGFWACFTCQQRPTVESAIRQVSNLICMLAVAI